MLSKLTSVCASGAILTITPKLVWACAVCGLPAGDHAAHAFDTSILFMMAVPYTVCAVAAVVGWCAYRNGRRRVRERMQKGAAARL
jgi:heme/copper-type cytochrome/quinol oxidase subunit 2